MRHVLLFTGGMDSFLAFNKLYEDSKIDKIELVYIDLNYQYLDKAELNYRNELVRKLKSAYDQVTQSNMFDTKVKDLGILDLINYNKVAVKDVANVPARNLLIAASVAAHINDDCKIYLTVQKGEMNIPDRSDRFFVQTTSLLSFLIGKDVEIVPVFPHMTKVQAARDFLEVRKSILSRTIKEFLLKQTYSCYVDKFRRCGKCGACVRTIIVHACLDILDPDMFEVSPLPIKDVLPAHIAEYYNAAITYKYDSDRCREIVFAVDNLYKVGNKHETKFI